MARMVYKAWRVMCPACGSHHTVWGWSHDAHPCPECGAETVFDNEIVQRAPGVIDDTFVGGLMVPHAVCHDDGTPRRFDSKSELRKALADKGWTISGESPQVERNRWI